MTDTIIVEHLHLVSQVLRRYGIYPNHQDYEDYFQELALDLYIELKRLVHADVTIYSVKGYLIRHLDWSLKKLFRKRNRSRETATEDQLLSLAPYQESDYQRLEWLQSVKANLSYRDRILLDCLLEERSTADICQTFHCPPRTVDYWIKKLRQKVRILLEPDRKNNQLHLKPSEF